ncbi:PQQ-dependent sugar dehydrogenase [Corallibacter sp.]|uniref:PQQ-dependent sugar dehydrogenase n=1 Tax=Corallibacter sp. TaxID=2038084 RepID=UPI003AB1F668
MKKLYTSILLLTYSIVSISQSIDIEPYASGFTNPVSIKHAGDNRLFIVERAGVIKIVNNDGSTNPTPFIDINTLVSNSGGERGLLGLAFHPNYLTNGFFYVNYINNNGDTVISRFVTNPPDNNTANPSTEEILLTIAQPYSNHNGGDIAFGSDGYLYIATGDGGSGGDPENRSQNLNSLLGKLLRIDVNTASGGNNYRIPSDNPFVGTANARDEIWAYGLRNPWRFSFDRQTNDIWIADVGQNDIEEINMVPITTAGVNYGWRCYEGNSAYNTTGCPDVNTITFPVSQYSHSGSGAFKCSISGGYRYRGTAQSTLSGLYFFADYCSNEIGILEYNGTTWDMSFTQQYSGNNWTAFGEDVDGEIYVAGLSSGNIFKIVDTNLSTDEFNLSSIKMYPNPTNDMVYFDNSSATNNISKIIIYNIQGTAIKTVNNTNNSSIKVSTKDLASGLYLTEITATNEKTSLKKLIIY